MVTQRSVGVWIKPGAEIALDFDDFLFARWFYSTFVICGESCRTKFVSAKWGKIAKVAISHGNKTMNRLSDYIPSHTICPITNHKNMNQLKIVSRLKSSAATKDCAIARPFPVGTPTNQQHYCIYESRSLFDVGSNGLIDFNSGIIISLKYCQNYIPFAASLSHMKERELLL